MQKSSARDVNIESTTPLISPIALVNKIPMTPEVEATVLSGREQIRAILNGEDDRLLMITGPCSIHDEKAALDWICYQMAREHSTARAWFDATYQAMPAAKITGARAVS